MTDELSLEDAEDLEISEEELKSILSDDDSEPEIDAEVEPDPEPQAEAEDDSGSESGAESARESTPQPQAITREQYDSMVQARDGLIHEKNATRKELAEAKARIEALEAAQAQSAGEPEEEPDEFQQLVRGMNETREGLASIQEQMAQEREVQQLRAQIQNASNWRAEQEKAYTEEVPTYQEDIDHARKALVQGLISRGVTQEDATRTLLIEEAKFTLEAQRQNINPAEALYTYAQQNGLLPQREEAQAEAEPEPAPKSPVRKAKSQSLSRLGGSPPVGGNAAQEKFESMTSAEVEALVDNEEELDRMLKEMGAA